jgi:hypothetical protein
MLVGRGDRAAWRGDCTIKLTITTYLGSGGCLACTDDADEDVEKQGGQESTCSGA